MTYLKRILLIAVVLFSCIGCDQISKMFARNTLAASQPLSFLGDIFRLQYAENAGAFLGLGKALPENLRFWLFTISVGAVLAGMLVFILVRQDLRPMHVTGLTLITAGGLGNFIDRTMNNGVVIDFMNIGVGSLRTGIFNVADMALMAGAGMLVFLSLLEERKQKQAAVD